MRVPPSAFSCQMEFPALGSPRSGFLLVQVGSNCYRRTRAGRAQQDPHGTLTWSPQRPCKKTCPRNDDRVPFLGLVSGEPSGRPHMNLGLQGPCSSSGVPVVHDPNSQFSREQTFWRGRLSFAMSRLKRLADTVNRVGHQVAGTLRYLFGTNSRSKPSALCSNGSIFAHLDKETTSSCPGLWWTPNIYIYIYIYMFLRYP